jgi:serine/threonine protein kinase
MAPESILDRIYTTQSDVWSYGVLVWEIFSFGRSPYHNIAIDDLIMSIAKGNRLSKPEICPDEMFALI